MKGLLRPLALLYGAVTGARNALYNHGFLKSYRSTIPVISIGNITVGGTGKTPLSIFLARELKYRGHKPVILTRGYGGTVTSPTIISAADSPLKVGDEPLVIASAGVGPVVVSPNRVAGMKLIEREQLGSVVLLDDGLQHRRLARTVNIIAIDCSSERAIKEFLQGRLIPEGWFREGRAGALVRADIVLLNHRVPKARAIDAGQIKKILPANLPVFESYLTVARVAERSSGEQMQMRPSVIAICALANPEGFFTTVEYMGATIVKRVAVRDHATFTAEFLEQLSREHPNASLICSPKDAVKLPKEGIPRIFVLDTDLEIEGSEKLLNLIASRF